MSLSIHQTAVRTITHMLGSLAKLLDKAEADAAQRGCMTSPCCSTHVLRRTCFRCRGRSSRPAMWRKVRWGVSAASRFRGFPDTETTLPELREAHSQDARIRRKRTPAASFDGAEVAPGDVQGTRPCARVRRATTTLLTWALREFLFHTLPPRIADPAPQTASVSASATISTGSRAPGLHRDSHRRTIYASAPGRPGASIDREDDLTSAQEVVVVAWFYLFLAGLFKIGWAIGLKHTYGWTRLVPSLLTLAAMAVSFWLLSLALEELPIGTAYAIWTGSRRGRPGDPRHRVVRRSGNPRFACCRWA